MSFCASLSRITLQYSSSFDVPNTSCNPISVTRLYFSASCFCLAPWGHDSPFSPSSVYPWQPWQSCQTCMISGRTCVCCVSEHTFEMLIPLILPMTECGKWHHSKLWASEWWVCVGVGIKMWSYFSSLIYITDSYNEKHPGCHSRQSTKQKRCKPEGKSIRIFVTADRNSCKPNPKIQVMMLIFHFCLNTLTINLMSLKSRHQVSSGF